MKNRIDILMTCVPLPLWLVRTCFKISTWHFVTACGGGMISRTSSNSYISLGHVFHLCRGWSLDTALPPIWWRAAAQSALAFPAGFPLVAVQRLETQPFEALAVKLFSCCVHAADIIMEQFTRSQCDHLVDSHCSQHCWYLLCHLLPCILNILTLHKEQFHSCVFAQSRPWTACMHLGYHTPSPSLYQLFFLRLPWCHPVFFCCNPRASLESSILWQFCAEKGEVASWFGLHTGAIAKKAQHKHLRMRGLQVIQHWIEVLPYCWAMVLKQRGSSFPPTYNNIQQLSALTESGSCICWKVNTY